MTAPKTRTVLKLRHMDHCKANNVRLNRISLPAEPFPVPEADCPATLMAEERVAYLAAPVLGVSKYRARSKYGG